MCQWTRHWATCLLQENCEIVLTRKKTQHCLFVPNPTITCMLTFTRTFSKKPPLDVTVVNKWLVTLTWKVMTNKYMLSFRYEDLMVVHLTMCSVQIKRELWIMKPHPIQFVVVQIWVQAVFLLHSCIGCLYDNHTQFSILLQSINKSHVGDNLVKTNPTAVCVTLAELCGLAVLALCLHWSSTLLFCSIVQFRIVLSAS